MARRYSVRGIRNSRVYLLKSAARSIGVSEPTLRKWRAHGLKIIDDQRPYLVRGADLIDFLEKQNAADRTPMMRTQFYCMGCSTPRDPLGGAVDYTSLSELTGRLSGVCAECGCKIGRFCKASEVEELRAAMAAVFKANT